MRLLRLAAPASQDGTPIHWVPWGKPVSTDPFLSSFVAGLDIIDKFQNDAVATPPAAQMATGLSKVAAFAAIPAVAICLGSLVAAVRSPSLGVRSAVQHLAGGALFAAVAAELLPDLVHRRLPWVTLASFSLGVLAMLGLKELTRRLEVRADEASAQEFPTSLLLTSGVDILLDGLLIGISFAASVRQGMLVTLALTLEVLFLGVAVTAAFSGPRARRQAVVTSLVFALGLLWGAASGAYFLADSGPIVVDAVMAFAVAALLYLVTEELLTEAHKVRETPLLTTMFFAGFIVLLVIEMLI